MDKLYYGAAYYDEYMPEDRLEKDIAMMKKAGINLVRIGESTWSTYEPQEGVFDFSHLERVMDAMEEAGISVIVGTPTYAVPAWMVKSHPDVLALTKSGRGIYGHRQIMDITHPVYLFYAERIIREMMKRTADRKCVIGYQLDNETKYYGTAGENVQRQFVKYLREKFQDNLDAMNREFGLDYWSNRVDAWEDFPDVRGTINGSLGAEFEKFQRSLVTKFLSWQAGILQEYKREEQFITHNLDFEWRGHSYGVQPGADHFQIAKCLTVAGTDIYHPTQDELTGKEIAFGGDLIRSLKRDNYLILETEAQGFPCWTPYKGQLRLQAFSHIASGANAVEYWHWHSIHNSLETYWKGLLSHDFEENETYLEACTVGRDFEKFGKSLVNLKKKNDVAILVSNESLTALEWFGIEATAASDGGLKYNDIVRWMYDTLYQHNIECDFIWEESEHLSEYKMIAVPALYAAGDALLKKLNTYVTNGGTLVTTFKSGFTNEHVKVSHGIQPHILHQALGVTYHQFTFPRNVELSGDIIHGAEKFYAKSFMELLIPGEDTEVLASYGHYNWKDYSAITRHRYGKGWGYYIGCMTEDTLLWRVLKKALSDADIQNLPKVQFPIILRKGQNESGKLVWFYLNYSPERHEVVHQEKESMDLFSGKRVKQGDSFGIEGWDFRILEEC
ncbi:MAG: beta-galactosidase [Roseburia sp.]|nr:beta-galactosidase [Roseburia sp.]